MDEKAGGQTYSSTWARCAEELFEGTPVKLPTLTRRAEAQRLLIRSLMTPRSQEPRSPQGHRKHGGLLQPVARGPTINVTRRTVFLTQSTPTNSMPIAVFIYIDLTLIPFRRYCIPLLCIWRLLNDNGDWTGGGQSCLQFPFKSPHPLTH